MNPNHIPNQLSMLSVINGDEFAKWITGFFEGDGSFNLGTSLSIEFYQTEIDVIQYISSKILHGKIYEHNNNNYSLRYHGRYAIDLLNIISQNIVSIHRTNQINMLLNKLNLNFRCIENNVSIEWLTGFWEAEGSSSSRRMITLSQKEEYVMNKIQQEFGGHVSKDSNYYRWSICGDDSRILANEILEKNHSPLKAERLYRNIFEDSYYDLHKEQLQLKAKSNYLLNKDKISLSHKDYYLRNKEKVCSKSMEYYYKQKDMVDTTKRLN